MKHIPNIITSFRLVAAILILASCVLGCSQPYFLTLFIIAGISDMMDGFIARRFNWCTEFGARLDSISDLSLYISVIVCLSQSMAGLLKPDLPFLFAGLFAQAVHIALAYQRLGHYPSYHSDFARVCAYIMFFSIGALWLFHLPHVICVLSLLWVACCAEGIAMTYILRGPASNVSNLGQALELRRAA